MNKKLIKAIKDSIAHWLRMRKWVKKQSPDEYASFFLMKESLGETWSTTDCALCIYYGFDSFNIADCKNCILAKKYSKCSIGQWCKIHKSKTWAEWYKYSTIMLRQLKSLLPRKIA